MVFNSRFAWLAVATVFALACEHRQAASPRFEAFGPSCKQHQAELVEFVRGLPERTMPTWLDAELPESVIGAVPGGEFPVLQISENGARLDDVALEGKTALERAKSAAGAMQRRVGAGGEHKKESLYVAATPSIDVQTLRTYLTAIPREVSVRLLVHGPAPERFTPAHGAEDESAKSTAQSEDPEAHAIGNQLFNERDAKKRSALSAQAFSTFSRCAKVLDAVSRADRVEPGKRWPTLRSALLEALPTCRCDELATQSLKQILVAEQRAGSGSLAALPAEFLRDERCGASMPLRSLGKLVGQMERFDAEFSGGYQQNEIAFEEVLTHERLLNTFCNALPGETLAQLARTRSVLYWKSGDDACQAFRFEPMSTGAPMGTLRQVAPASQAPRAFHYWQGAEEVRVFGPVSGVESKPTETREWACDQNLKLTSVDAEALSFEHGRWFFREDSCRHAAPDSSLLGGCLGGRVPAAP